METSPIINNVKTPNQNTIQQMFAHQKFSNFVLYSFSCLFFGMMVTTLGPLLPYLASHQRKDQTYYSYLFISRAFGFTFGALTVKVIQSKFTYHHFAAIGVFMMGISAILFDQTQSVLLRGIFIFFSSAGCAFQETSLNLSALECFKGANTVMWLQALHGFFGIGGLLGPYTVYLFELHSLTVVGVGSLFALYFYFHLPTPEHEPHNQSTTDQNNQQLRSLPNIGLYLISLGFFFTIGQQCSYGGWISSYTVLNNFSTKQHATLYSSIYWISITAFRFILANLSQSLSSTYKIQILGIIGAINSLISYYIIFYIQPQFGLYFMSIIFGLANCSLYAFLLTVGEQFGYRIGIHETTCFCIAGSLGQGFLTVGVGKMMGWFSYNWLLYGMFIMNFGLALTARFTEQELSLTKKKQDNQIGIQLLDRKVHSHEEIQFH